MQLVDCCAGCGKPDTRGYLFPAPASTPDPCTCWKRCYWCADPTGLYADRSGEPCKLERGHDGHHDWQDEDERPRERVQADGLGYQSPHLVEPDDEPDRWAHTYRVSAAMDAERERYGATVASYTEAQGVQ